jgi:radical SAM superfamily enzyme YgiQ (UPF0313 family)
VTAAKQRIATDVAVNAERACNVLLVCPRFQGMSFWNLTAVCEVFGARIPAPPLGLITVAAMLPPSWECRLVNRNTEELLDADLEWADLVMTGGMMPQRPDAHDIIRLAQAHGKPVVVGGPDITSSPDDYAQADFRVLGEAEGIIDKFIASWDSGVRQGTFEAEKFKADVTKTPVPRYDLLKRHQYMYYGVQFARGCPFTCEFCDIIEIYGRVPRVKTVEQVLTELDVLYSQGYRGHLDFMDDNFIGNKKAVKALLPHVIEWQKAHGYPFEFSTEASINLADDDALLALMREANFFAIFVGLESPDPDTLVSMRKKQNTRRDLAESVHKIYRAGISVTAGFIVGFDSEKSSVAEAMIECIEATSIPVCMVGLLFALAGTQLTRRLEKEGRLLPPSFVDRLAELGNGDHCAVGLNFHTARPRRDILSDLKTIMTRVYSIEAYFGRVRTMVGMMDRPKRDRSKASEFMKRHFGVSWREIGLVLRLFWHVARRQPAAFRPFFRIFFETLRRNPENLGCVFTTAAFYLHLAPFVRKVVSTLEYRLTLIRDEDGLEEIVGGPMVRGPRIEGEPALAMGD